MKVLGQLHHVMAVKVMLFLVFSISQLSAAKEVCTSCTYTRIEDALKGASAYDTIVVRAGEYDIPTLEIKMPVFLLGVGRPSLKGAGDHELVVIQSDSVVFRGFRLANVAVSYIKDRSAIRLVNCKYVHVSDNIIDDAFFGIYLQNTKHCIIKDNIIQGAATAEYSSGNAIHVWKADDISILGNEASGHRDGIYFEFVNNSFVEGNRCTHNLRYGLHFMFSNDDRYADNVFSQNGVGVAVMFSRAIVMKDNSFTRNWGGAAYGLLLKEINDCTLQGNLFEQNTTGVYMEGTNRVLMDGNDFIENGWALDIKGNCQNNEIKYNNFIGNTFEVVTNSREVEYHVYQNYWSHYRGFDLDKNGIGDTPHRPVSLFAMLVDEIPATSLYLHSFLQYVLEGAERVIPTITPSNLIDTDPKMKPVGYAGY